MSFLGNGLLVVVGIGLLIFVHELGHFLCARWIGARVEVFSLGFGPRLFGWRRGATDYRVSLIPLGGYVAVAGQDAGDHRFPPDESLHDKTVGQRALFFCGGVVMNVLFALVAFPIAFGSGVNFPAPEVGGVEHGSPAWEARIAVGDRVLSVDGKAMYSFENLVVEIALAGPRQLRLLTEHDGERRTVDVTPRFRAQDGIYAIGIESTFLTPTLIVDAAGPARTAGLHTGDQLLAVNGRPTFGPSLEPAAPPPPNAPVQLLVRRDGAEITATVTPSPTAEQSPPQIGVRAFRRVVGGVRSDLRPLAALGLQHGDVLLEVDGQPYCGPDLAVAATGGPELRLRVRRGDRELDLSTPVSAAERQQLADHLALVPEADGLTIEVVAGGAAAAAGIRTGDRLRAIDGSPLADWDDLRGRVLDAAGRNLRIEVEHRAAAAPTPPERRTFDVAPQQGPLYDLGFERQYMPKLLLVQATGIRDALRLGSVCALDLVKQLYVTTKRLLTGEVAAKNLGGIIQISRQSYQNTQLGLARFLYFLALLSINLAFINVLPIPVLDGGHLLFLLIERIKGSPVSVNVLNYSQVLGLVLVLALVVFVTYNDILRLF
jgi:regulator of sigma E protease